MRVVDLTKANDQNAGIMAFGFFDSIHLGHQAVIRTAIQLAEENRTISSVFLFKNNIYPILGMDKSPIFTFEERVALIESLGVDAVYYVDADPKYLSLSPTAFIADLKSHVRLLGFTCGKDFSFGEGGHGRVEDMIDEIGGDYSVCDLIENHGEKISSERVKGALKEGDLPLVRRYLGRDFSIVRNVIQGRKDGSKIGFPTINSDLLNVPLRDGVYFTLVRIGDVVYRAVTNVGAHPTFGDMKKNVESHLLDYNGDIYNQEVEITFLAFHRGIQCYDSVGALVDQITKDVEERRRYD